MKKTSIIMVVAMALVVCVLGCCITGTTEIARADENVNESVVTYTMVDEVGTVWTVTILDETNCKLSDGTTETALTYTLVDGILTLTNPETGVVVAFVVNVDNTLSKYVPETDNETETPGPDSDSIKVEAEVDEKQLTEQVAKIIEDFLGNYLQETYVAQIISWLIETGVLGALVVIFLKYRKFRHTTIGDIEKLVNEKIKESLGENFKGIDANVNKMILDIGEEISILREQNKVLIQAIALSQDTSSEGRIAMLKLAQGITEDKRVIEKIEEIKEEIVAQDEAVKVVEEKVQGEYKDINIF